MPATENRRLPDVIGIGFQKCGTVSLHNYLKAHPEVGVTRRKETRFFAVGGDPRIGETGNWHRGVDWYLKQFPPDKRVLVESFGGWYTDYPRELGVPERIQSVAPDARFLALVRDPIDRAVSHYVQDYSNSIEHRSIEEALGDPDDNHYVDRSLYFMQLERYLRIFDPSRFLVIDHRDLRHSRRETLATVFRFLGVRDDYWDPSYEVEHHQSAVKRRNKRVGMAIQRAVGDRIFRRLHGRQRHLFKFAAYAPFSEPIARPEVPPHTRRRLLEVFEPDIRALEDFTGRSFAHWR